MAKGKAYIYKDVLLRDSELFLIDRTQIGEEKDRIQQAIDDVRKCLAIDANQIEGKLGKQSADIFRAQEAILLDTHVVKEMKKVLESELLNAEQVVRTVFRNIIHYSKRRALIDLRSTLEKGMPWIMSC
jgi:phosphoenolpyruvate-protein kinase (PTS system EI component)